jgi:hypothetical protein
MMIQHLDYLLQLSHSVRTPVMRIQTEPMYRNEALNYHPNEATRAQL